MLQCADTRPDKAMFKPIRISFQKKDSLSNPSLQTERIVRGEQVSSTSHIGSGYQIVAGCICLYFSMRQARYRHTVTTISIRKPATIQY